MALGLDAVLMLLEKLWWGNSSRWGSCNHCGTCNHCGSFNHCGSGYGNGLVPHDFVDDWYWLRNLDRVGYRNGIWLWDWDLNWVWNWYMHWPWNWNVDREGRWNWHWPWNHDGEWPWNWNSSVYNHKLGRNWDGETLRCAAKTINDQTSCRLEANEADADAGVGVLGNES